MLMGAGMVLTTGTCGRIRGCGACTYLTTGAERAQGSTDEITGLEIGRIPALATATHMRDRIANLYMLAVVCVDGFGLTVCK
ncbi:hypothetical protein TKK_0007102 [Trichogramma kaykai]